MLEFIRLSGEEEYIISGEGLNVVVMVMAGQVEIYDKSGTKLANLNIAGESYTAMNAVLKVKAITNPAHIVIASFPVIL